MAQHSRLPRRAVSTAGAAALSGWLRQRGMLAQELAAAIEIRPETLSRWIQGRLVPSKVARLAIEHVTGGAVAEDSWTIISRVQEEG